MAPLLTRLSYRLGVVHTMGALALCCTVLWLASFTDPGLRWWLGLAPDPMVGLLWMFAALAVVAVFVVWMLADSFGEGLFGGVLGTMVAFLMFVSIGDDLSKWDAAHVGPLSVFRAGQVYRELQNAPPGSPAARAWRQRLENPTHASLRAAFVGIEPKIQAQQLERVLDAASLLGLNEHPVIRSARKLGYVQESQFQQLRQAARDKAATDPTLSRWTPLQQAAFLALTQEGGLDQPLRIPPPPGKSPQAPQGRARP